MRIGIFSECFPPTMNGVSVSIETFRKYMIDQGHDVYIFTTSCPKQEQNDQIIPIPTLFTFGLKLSDYPVAAPQSVSKWIEIVASYNLDIIHCQHLFSSGILGLSVAKKLNIPVVLTYHTLLTDYIHHVPFVGWLLNLWPFSLLARKWIIGKSRKYCNMYDQIVSPSPSMEKLLREYGVTVPIESIPTGINPSDFEDQYTKEDLHKTWGISQDQKYILLYVGRVSQEKNVDFLLRAMKTIVEGTKDREGRQDTHLILVGGGKKLQEYQKLVDNWRISEHVTFTGKMDKDKTNQTFGGADVFVYPAFTDTQGIIISEAMMSGLPVVAVGIMGPTDSVKNEVDGYLVGLNENDFADKVNYLLDHSEVLRRMGQNAKLDAMEVTADKTGSKMEKLYEQVINNHRSK